MSSVRLKSHRASFVESLESRQFLCATVVADTANLTVSHADTAPIVMKAAAAAANGQVIWGEAKAGVKLHFKKSKALPGNGIFGFVHEQGTFSDEKGNTGTYELVIPPKLSSVQPVQVLNLTWKTKFKMSRGLTLQFTPATKRLNAGLNNKSVSFVKPAAGTSAKAVAAGNLGLSIIYLKY